MTFRLAFVALCGLLLGAEAAAFAQQKPAPRYTIEDAGTANRAIESITPSLSSAGQVGSWALYSRRGASIHLYQSGKTTYIPSQIEGYPLLYPAGFNAQGAIVGIAKTLEDNVHGKAFLYQDGKFQTLPGLGGKDEAAWAMNASGQIVGGAETPDKTSHACLWESGAVKDLGTLGKGCFSMAHSINAQGWIVGVGEISPKGARRAILWKNGRTIDLGIYPGGNLSHARAINDKGEIAGWVDTSEVEIEAAVWRNGKLKKLDSLGNEPSSVWDINNHGAMVGTSSDPKKRMHACLWESDKPYDLNALIPPASGWRLRYAYRINDAGQIVGAGVYKGLIRIFLLTPVKTTAALPNRYCQRRPAAIPVEGKSAPPFSLKDTEGANFSLTENRGRPMVLFFFCGCKRCLETAKRWGEIQRSDVMKQMALRSASVPAPLTVVLYQGTTEEAQTFASATNLDMRLTTLLPDKQMKVTLPYHALPCPRVFALDRDHKVMYTNTHVDDAPQKGTAATILSRVLSALDGNPGGITPASPIPPTNAKLVVLAKNGVERITETSARYNFGEVDPVTHIVLKRDFVIYNPGSVSVSLRTDTTCGCTGAVLNADGKELNYLPPKQSAKVSVTVQTARLKPGSQSKFVYLFSGSDPVPLASLEVLADIHSVVTFEPKIINFSDVKAGATATLPLLVRLDGRLMERGKMPPLVCSAPNVRILAQTSRPILETRNGRATYLQTYQVSLTPDAPIGRVSGEIYIAPKTTTQKTSAEEPIVSLGGVWAQVQASVNGDIQALPDVVVFGSLERGATHQRDTLIRAKSAQMFSTLKIAPKQPYLSARLVDRKDNTAYVRIILGKQAPLGDGRGEVTLTTANGERLILKVIYSLYKPTP